MARINIEATDYIDESRQDINDNFTELYADKAEISGQVFTGPVSFSGTTNSGLKVNSLTTAQRDALTPANGMVIYNSTTGYNQVYQNSAWENLTADPTGAIKIWPTDTAPNGYKLCDGSAISRSTNSDLFDVIGTTYGAGDGSTTFNIPNTLPLPTYYSGLTYSARFVGDKDKYLSVADNADLSFTGNMTLECWVKFESIVNDLSTFINKWDYASGQQRSYSLGYLKNSAQIQFSTAVQVNIIPEHNGTWSFTPELNRWYHFAVVFTASTGTAELFVDGVSYGTQTGYDVSIADSTSPFVLGTDNTSTSTPLNGDMMLVRAWNITRTGEQIRANRYKLLGSTTGLKGEWSLSNILTDNSGNSHTLTNTGSITFVPSENSGEPFYYIIKT